MLVENIVAIIIALCAVGSIIIALQARHTIQTIHILVNSKMSDALSEIQTLKKEVQLQKTLPPEK